jgi:very-short-patch-repair endonuclease
VAGRSNGEFVAVACPLDDQAELAVGHAHGTKSAFHDDRARDRRLTAAGYTITHITWNQLDDEPEALAADLRALLP